MNSSGPSSTVNAALEKGQHAHGYHREDEMDQKITVDEITRVTEALAPEQEAALNAATAELSDILAEILN